MGIMSGSNYSTQTLDKINNDNISFERPTISSGNPTRQISMKFDELKNYDKSEDSNQMLVINVKQSES